MRADTGGALQGCGQQGGIGKTMGAESSGQAWEAWEPPVDLERVDGDMGSSISSFYEFALGLVSWSSTLSKCVFPLYIILHFSVPRICCGTR